MRRREGGHSPSNLVLLCSSCHRFVTVNPLEAQREGWVVPTWASPENVPVRIYSGDWMVFRPDYGVDFVYDVVWIEPGLFADNADRVALPYLSDSPSPEQALSKGLPPEQ